MTENTEKISFPIFKKVLFIGPDIHGRGGISSVLASYAENFAFFNYLATNSDKGKIRGYLRTICTFFRIPFARLKGRKIAHFHYCSGRSWYRKKILMAWCRLWGYKIVAHSHSGGLNDFANKIGVEKIRKVLNKASVNIVLSEFWENFFESTLKVQNTRIVNNIVSKPGYIKDFRREDAVPTFIFLGLLDKAKGIFDILAAAEQLKSEGLKFKIIVGGNGNVETFKNCIRDLQLDDFVDYRGWMRDQDKTRAFMESDVLMLPSSIEGLPITILEAMSYGKGIITTSVGGIPEVVTDGVNGIMVTYGDVDRIARAMKEYIENPDLKKRHADHGYKVVENFYPEKIGNRLAEIYNSII